MFTRLPSLWMLLTAALAAFLAGTAPSIAQGTSHAFPDPISSREFKTWIDMTDLSDEDALLAAEALDEYQPAFRILRDGPIEAWLADRAERPDDLANARARLIRQRSILKQIAALEAALAEAAANRVGGSDTLQQRLAHRATRRQAIQVAGGQLRQGIDADLLQAIHRMELDQTTRDAIEPQLVSWEGRTSASLAKLADSAIERDIERMRAGISAFPEMTAEEGDSFDEAWERWQSANAELMADQYAARNRIARETMQAVDGMQEHLPPESFDGLRSRMLREVYGRWFPDRDAPLQLFSQARTAFVNDPETLAAIESIHLDWQGAHRDIENRIVNRVEDERSQGGAVGQLIGGVDAWQARRQDIRSMAVTRVEVNDAARDSLREVLGETIEVPFPNAPAQERAVRRRGAVFLANDSPTKPAGEGPGPDVQAVIAISIGGPEGMTNFGGTIETNGQVIELDSSSLEGGVFVVDTGDGGEFELDLENVLEGISGMIEEIDFAEHIGGSFDSMPGMPMGSHFMGMGRPGPALRPLTRSQLQRFIQRNDLGESPTEIATILHEDYLDEFDVLSSALHAPSGFMPFGMGVAGTPDGEELGTEARFQHNHDVVMEAHEADRRFLLDLHTVLSGGIDPAELDALASARERAFWRIASGGGSHVSMPGRITSHESDVDLVELVDATMATRPEEMEEILAAWTARAGPLLRERFEIHHAVGLALAQFEETLADTIMETNENENGTFSSVSRSISIDEDDVAEGEALGREREDADKGVAVFNRETIETMARELPPADRAALESAWRRAAWPGVFLDYTAVDAQILAAQSLEVIDADQLATVATIAAEHEAAYEALSIAIINAARTRPEPQGLALGRTGAGLSDEVEKLRFQRNELNARTLRRLQQAVGAENVQRIGAPVPPSTTRPPFFMNQLQPQD